MLIIELEDLDLFDEEKNEFYTIKGRKVRFEYTLKALYDWEGRWNKPFLDEKVKLSKEEIEDFYYRMALDPFDRRLLSNDVMMVLGNYIKQPMTATRFTQNVEGKTKRSNRSGKIYTAEEIYALMINAGIPLEWEHRNLNRLLVLLRIISINNSPPKKMSRSDVLKQNAKLNAERKARLKTKG